MHCETYCETFGHAYILRKREQGECAKEEEEKIASDKRADRSGSYSAQRNRLKKEGLNPVTYPTKKKYGNMGCIM